MLSAFGCDLYKCLFDPDDPINMQLAYTYIRSAIQSWEPRVGIVDLSVSASATDRDSNQMMIFLTLQFSGDSPDQAFLVAIPLSALQTTQ